MFSAMNQIIETTTIRQVAPSDVQRRLAAIEVWEDQHEAILQSDRDTSQQQATIEALGPRPVELTVGQELTETERSGGQGIFWPGGLVPVDDSGARLESARPVPVGEPTHLEDRAFQQVLRYPEGTRFRGEGNFRLDFLLYSLVGIDLTTKSNAALATLELPPKIITPFMVMIVMSLFTRPVRRELLDRYYAKMKTMVDPDPEIDRRNLEAAYANPQALEHRKMFPGTNLEVQKPTRADVVGVVACFGVCVLVIVLAMAVARIGA